MREDALCVVMAIAPGTLSRNRYFHLFQAFDFMRARSRANRIRSVARELGHVPGDSITLDGDELRYAHPAMGYKRSVALSRIDRLVLARLVGRTDIAVLPLDEVGRSELNLLLRCLQPSPMPEGV